MEIQVDAGHFSSQLTVILVVLNFFINNVGTLLMRDKNKQTLEEMGFTTLDVQNELLRLDYKDYISGPKPDDDPKQKGDIWEFGKNIHREDVYIKIKLTPNNKPVCLSFHYPERDLNYFFK